MHDPGGKVRIALPDDVVGLDDISPCGQYRRRLERDWTSAGQPPRTILWIGMNPSVADAQVSDPTCNRELGFSRRDGFTRYLKGNVLDWRATNPNDLPLDPSVACSAENKPALLDMAQQAEFVVMAYGKLHARYHETVADIVSSIRETGVPLRCLGRNKDGSPKHPLYLAKTTEFMPFG